MREFLKLIDPLRARGGTLRILDVGGTIDYWRALPGLYGAGDVEITVVNLDANERQEANILARTGNACSLPFADGEFDVVHSNSVIEHVGHWEQMAAMAAEVRRLGPAYFVQTPNVWFPVEPHFKLPFVHWLPEQMRIGALKLAGRLPREAQPGEATRAVQRIVLLSAPQLRALFPDAEIWRERVAGFTKSLVARRNPGSSL